MISIILSVCVTLVAWVSSGVAWVRYPREKVVCMECSDLVVISLDGGGGIVVLAQTIARPGWEL